MVVSFLRLLCLCDRSIPVGDAARRQDQNSLSILRPFAVLVARRAILLRPRDGFVYGRHSVLSSSRSGQITDGLVRWRKTTKFTMACRTAGCKDATLAGRTEAAEKALSPDLERAVHTFR